MNNILNIEIEVFIKKTETEIIEANFKTKIQTILETGTLEDFTGSCMTITKLNLSQLYRKTKQKSLSLLILRIMQKKTLYIAMRPQSLYFIDMLTKGYI